MAGNIPDVKPTTEGGSAFRVETVGKNLYVQPYPSDGKFGYSSEQMEDIREELSNTEYWPVVEIVSSVEDSPDTLTEGGLGSGVEGISFHACQIFDNEGKLNKVEIHLVEGGSQSYSDLAEMFRNFNQILPSNLISFQLETPSMPWIKKNESWEKISKNVNESFSLAGLIDPAKGEKVFIGTSSCDGNHDGCPHRDGCRWVKEETSSLSTVGNDKDSSFFTLLGGDQEEASESFLSTPEGQEEFTEFTIVPLNTDWDGSQEKMLGSIQDFIDSNTSVLNSEADALSPVIEGITLGLQQNGII